MMIPGPDHPITIRPGETRWRVKFAGHVIADSADALVLVEAAYPPAIYFPRQDVSMEFLSRTARSTAIFSGSPAAPGSWKTLPLLPQRTMGPIQSRADESA